MYFVYSLVFVNVHLLQNLCWIFHNKLTYVRMDMPTSVVYLRLLMRSQLLSLFSCLVVDKCCLPKLHRATWTFLQ